MPSALLSLMPSALLLVCSCADFSKNNADLNFCSGQLLVLSFSAPSSNSLLFKLFPRVSVWECDSAEHHFQQLDQEQAGSQAAGMLWILAQPQVLEQAIEQSHTTQRSRQHDNGTEPSYLEILAAWQWNRATLPGDPGERPNNERTNADIQGR